MDDGLVLDHRPVALGHGGDRLGDVADHVGRERRVEPAAERVHAARGAQHGAEAALLAAHEAFVVPVGGAPLADRGRALGAVDGGAGHAADLGIGEVGHQRAQAPRVIDGGRVGEDYDLAPGDRDRLVLRQRLALARQREQLHAAGEAGAHDLLGRVGRAVGDHHHLEALGRIVEGEGVLELRGDHPLLVVGGDDEGHRRQDGRLPDRAGAQAREEEDEAGVARVHVDHERHRRPEDRRSHRPSS